MELLLEMQVFLWGSIHQFEDDIPVEVTEQQVRDIFALDGPQSRRLSPVLRGLHALLEKDVEALVFPPETTQR